MTETWEQQVSAVLGVDTAADGARAVASVPLARWHEAVQACRDELGCNFFDWLSAVDESDGGAADDKAAAKKTRAAKTTNETESAAKSRDETESAAETANEAADQTAGEAAAGPERRMLIIAHLWSIATRHGVLLRTELPVPPDGSRPDEAVATVTDLYPGASWHERETHEMFGVDFDGHPGLEPLLLPPEFEGHPLRKDFVLASRVVKPWPGEKEPGGGRPGPRKRAPKRPPGVPEGWMEPDA